LVNQDHHEGSIKCIKFVISIVVVSVLLWVKYSKQNLGLSEVNIVGSDDYQDCDWITLLWTWYIISCNDKHFDIGFVIKM